MRAPWLLLALPLSASAATLDFETLATPGFVSLSIDDVTGDPYVYEEDGFRIEEVVPDQGFKRFGDGDFRYIGSTAMYLNTPSGRIRMTHIAGVPFSMQAITLAELTLPSQVTVNFEGTRSDQSIVTASFTTDGITPLGEIVTFGPDWTDLVQVEWTQAPDFHQFDDIVLNETGIGLAVDSSCPISGPGSIDFTRVTPSSRMALLGAGGAGATVLPAGPCAGTVTGLDSSVGLIGFFFSDAQGEGGYVGFHTMNECGLTVQLVDLVSCEMSDAVLVQ